MFINGPGQRIAHQTDYDDSVPPAQKKCLNQVIVEENLVVRRSQVDVETALGRNYEDKEDHSRFMTYTE